MKIFAPGISRAAAVAALALGCVAVPAAGATDLLAQARQLAAPAKAYPELAQISTQVDMMIARMQSNTDKLRDYRKARIRGSDRRYAGLTREFNQARSRLSEIERKLGKAPSLDLSRFPMPPGYDRGSSSSDVRERALAGEVRKYDKAKTSLAQALKAISDHYDQQLREIAKVR
ncbi:MAG TPA: hypothetical protein VFV71_01755 [Burkholderiales bacterium]|nr:hypothetical protein [Burkholderiales bacterium]